MKAPETEHALRYATEATKLYLMDWYKREYPQYFGDAEMVTRPATDDDYFVPPSIASHCVVVQSTRFSELGCRTFSCFSLKKSWEPCTDADPPQWLHVGEGFELACQKSCADHDVDSEWTPDGRCVLANPLKKALATMPEKMFERTTPHLLHGGLNLEIGRLKLNRAYCEAYGLDYSDDNDCVVPGAQFVGEFLIGSTAIRAAKAAGVQAFSKPFPPLPAYLDFVRPKKRNKRSIIIQEDPGNLPILKEIALELSKDLGVEVTERAVKKFIKKKAPQLLSRAIHSITTKLVLRRSMMVGVKLGLKQLASVSLKAAGKAVPVVGTIYALYDLTSTIIDLVDPWDYMKVLDKVRIAEVDAQLDYQYFKDSTIRPELTPEHVWQYELLTENDGSIEYMISKVDEYLEALKKIPPNKYNFKAPQKFEGFLWVDNGVKDHTSGMIFKCTLVVLAVLSLLMLEWVHFTSCALFFLMLFYQAY